MSPVWIAGLVAGVLGLIAGIFIGVFSTLEEVTDLQKRLRQEKTLSEAIIKQLKQKLEEYKYGDGNELHGDNGNSDSDGVWY